MAAYLVKFERCDPGLLVSTPTIKKGATKPEGIPVSVVINPSSAQIQGVFGYLGLIKAGDDTSTVETAITALTP